MGRNRIFTDTQLLDAAKQCQNNAFDIAVVLNVTPMCVYNHAKRLKIPLVGHHATSVKKLTVPVFDAYRNNASVDDVAAKFGLSVNITKRMIHAGISIMWLSATPPIWPRPANLPQVKVFHEFNRFPASWDDDDKKLADRLHVKVHHVKAYRTMVTTHTTAQPVTTRRALLQHKLESGVPEVAEKAKQQEAARVKRLKVQKLAKKVRTSSKGE